MRLSPQTIMIVLLALSFAHPAGAQIADPIPEPVRKQGLEVQIEDIVRLPRTRGLLHVEDDTDPAGYARISYVIEAPDGRLFVNDQRGFLYILHGEAAPTLYANVAEAFPRTIYSRLQVGFAAFGFPKSHAAAFGLHSSSSSSSNNCNSDTTEHLSSGLQTSCEQQTKQQLRPLEALSDRLTGYHDGNVIVS